MSSVDPETWTVIPVAVVGQPTMVVAVVVKEVAVVGQPLVMVVGQPTIPLLPLVLLQSLPGVQFELLPLRINSLSV